MTGHERVVAAIEFGTPDRVPFIHQFFDGALRKYGQKALDLMASRPDDFGSGPWSMPLAATDEIVTETDEWGVVWERSPEYSAGEVRLAPLAWWDDLASYEFPPLPPDSHFEGLARRWKDPSRTSYALGGWFDTFERMQFLRGTENVFYDLADDREQAHDLAERIVRRNIEGIHRLITAGVDGVWLSDDWGSQQGLLISPQLWRSFFRPLYARMIEPLKDAGKHVFFHSCGMTWAIWDDLVELGIDAVNLQIPLNPPVLVDRCLRGKVCVFTDVDRQHAMPHGSPEEVQQHIQSLIALCGTPNGGVMMRGELEAVWPWPNILAMYQAYDEFCQPFEQDSSEAKRNTCAMAGDQADE